MESNYKNSNNCTFRLLGIRMNNCPNNNALQDCVRTMQKSLYGNNYWYYFYEGIEFLDDDKKCKLTPSLFDDGFIFNTEKTTISISAIVGKNGSGKSSIIDMFIRGINNLSAAILGEGYKYPYAEHLHYIENVYVSIAYFCKGEIYVISILGRSITLTPYKMKDVGAYYATPSRSINIVQDNMSPLTEKKEHYSELYNLFYTIVCNYSLYAFNYNDYLSERTPIERICKIYKNAEITRNPKEEDYHWLKGLFHKNDGYQVPIVIQPMRLDGVLDIKKENHLAKERLGQLLFYKSEGKYPFRTINDKMEIVGMTFVQKEEYTYNKANTIKALQLPTNTLISRHYDEFYNNLLKLLGEYFKFDCSEACRKNQLACDYLIYKTLKIISSYYMYEGLYKAVLKSPKNSTVLKNLINKLVLDESHITLKWRRIINFLRHPELQKLYYKTYASLDEIQKIYENLLDGEQTTNDAQSLHIDFCVPPIFDFDFQIVENSHSKGIPFEGLSSGERQMNYTISNIMYHLVNIDSAVMDHNKEDEYKMWYGKVNILLDEIELYYHPEMQRLFLYNLLRSLHSVRFYSIDGINILMVTHSPFVVSDLPQSNVLFLSKNANRKGKTFGGNITSMLNDHFFLNQSMGALAEAEISEIAKVYNLNDPEEQERKYLDKKDRFQYVAKIIGEPFLAKRVRIMLDELDGKYCVLDINKQIEQYRQKIYELELKLQKDVCGKV